MSDRRKTVLIVDSDEEVRESLTAMFRRDFRVLKASSGEGALQMMEKEDVDLMVVDVHLPGITGFEVLKITKENHPHVEVIVVSETQEVQIAIEAMRLHAFNYASKDRGLDSVHTLVTIAAAQAGPETRHAAGKTSPKAANASSSSDQVRRRAKSSSACSESRPRR